MNKTKELYRRPWPELQTEAWQVRQRYHPPSLVFAVPGTKQYKTEDYVNTPHRFASISLTGGHCTLRCEHCRGRLLSGMLPAPTADDLLALGQKLIAQGCQGVLISGGADADGAVPFKSHLSAVARLKEWGLTVIVHTGLLDRETAVGLNDAGVDQVLFDVVGDAETIHQVLHLDRSPQDYAETLAMLREVGLSVAPHVVVGLHFGQLRGELAALDMIHRVGADVIVLVVLRPLRRTPMANASGVAPQAIGKLAAVTRLSSPRIPLTLGCARPPGPVRIDIERRALLAGVNSIAYPDPATVRLAGELGLQTEFVESCCTLAVLG